MGNGQAGGQTGEPTRGQAGKPKRKTRNLDHFDDVVLPWDPARKADSLGLIVQKVDTEMREAINWYFRKKKWKSRVSWGLRLAAVAAVIATAIQPLLSQGLGDKTDCWFVKQPIWASVMLALAVWFVWMDKFVGSSSGWMRYIDAAFRLKKVRQLFMIDWLALRAAWGESGPQPEEVQAALNRIGRYSCETGAVVEEETKEWMVEFKSSLKLLEQAVQARATEEKTRAALHVTIKNYQAIEPKWTLVIGGVTTSVAGRSHGAVGLQPGPTNVRAVGRTQATQGAQGGAAHEVSASAIVTLKAGETMELELELQ